MNNRLLYCLIYNGRWLYGKILILTFEDREEDMLNHIISYVSAGARAFQVIENKKLCFNGLELDSTNRLVREHKFNDKLK